MFRCIGFTCQIVYSEARYLVTWSQHVLYEMADIAPGCRGSLLSALNLVKYLRPLSSI